MTDKSFIENGNNICDDMLSLNHNDYLTQKVSNEVKEIIKEMKTISDSVNGVRSAVNQERERVRLAALRRKREQLLMENKEMKS